jgi:hypothetical protein
LVVSDVDAGVDDRLTHRLRYQDLTRSSNRHHSRGDPHRYSAHFGASHFADAPVDAKTARQSQSLQALRQRLRTPHRAQRVSEGRKEKLSPAMCISTPPYRLRSRRTVARYSSSRCR